MTGLWNIYKNTCVPPGTPGSTNPPKCTTNIPMQWQLTAVAGDPPVACDAATPCASAAFPSCLEASPGSMLPCPVGGACVCKAVRQGFVEGAAATFPQVPGDPVQNAANLARLLNLTTLGDDFGVNRNLAP